MIQSRKGLSDIVTNVLIILLVLVAVGIIWAFVRPTINQGAGQLEGSSECLTADVEAVSCVLTGPSGSNYDAAVVYKRNVGGGDIKSIKLVYKDSTGSSRVMEHSLTTEIPAELESRSITDTLTNFAPTTVDVAVVINVANNPDGRTCPVREAPVACV